MQSPPPQRSPITGVRTTAVKELEVFLFLLGKRCFGIPLKDVRAVAQMAPEFPARGAEAHVPFEFQGRPISYVSLWDALDIPPEHVECDQLRAMLPMRLKDHIDWMVALENSILSGQPFTKARDPHQCAFGKWYYSFTAHDSRLAMLLAQFEKPHAAIHALADHLLALAEAGRVAEAKAAFDQAKSSVLPTLRKLFDSTQKRLLEMQRRVVVLAQNGEDIWALGADQVRGIVTVPSANVQKIPGSALGAKSDATSSLLTLDDQSVIPLLLWQQFCVTENAAEPKVA